MVSQIISHSLVQIIDSPWSIVTVLLNDIELKITILNWRVELHDSPPTSSVSDTQMIVI